MKSMKQDLAIDFAFFCLKLALSLFMRLPMHTHLPMPPLLLNFFLLYNPFCQTRHVSSVSFDILDKGILDPYWQS